MHGHENARIQANSFKLRNQWCTKRVAPRLANQISDPKLASKFSGGFHCLVILPKYSIYWPEPDTQPLICWKLCQVGNTVTENLVYVPLFWFFRLWDLLFTESGFTIYAFGPELTPALICNVPCCFSVVAQEKLPSRRHAAKLALQKCAVHVFHAFSLNCHHRLLLQKSSGGLDHTPESWLTPQTIGV